MRIKRNTKLGELFFEARTKKELTLRTLAKKTKVSFSSLVDMELGVRKAPSVGNVVKVAKYLKIGPKKVFQAVLHDELVRSTEF